MDLAAQEKELVRKLVFSAHLNVLERKGLPNQQAKGTLIYAVIEDALQSGEWFNPWWLPDDSMIGCTIMYRGDGPTRVCWTYSGIEGERSGVREYESQSAATEATLQEARQLWGTGIDGIRIDWDA